MSDSEYASTLITQEDGKGLVKFKFRVEWTALVKLDLFDIIMDDIIKGR